MDRKRIKPSSLLLITGLTLFFFFFLLIDYKNLAIIFLGIAYIGVALLIRDKIKQRRIKELLPQLLGLIVMLIIVIGYFVYADDYLK
ncbi:MAG: hypothetical protein OXH57_01890 [Ekhidna sp.]|nr:hypothetical protein [Ekhidna sp.]